VEILNLLLVSLVALGCAAYWRQRARQEKMLRDLLAEQRRLLDAIDAGYASEPQHTKKSGKLLSWHK
jgi:hypothetical protein